MQKMPKTLPTLPVAVRPEELEAVGLSGASIPGKDCPCITANLPTRKPHGPTKLLNKDVAVHDVCQLELPGRSQ